MSLPSKNTPPVLTCKIGEDNIIYLEMDGAISHAYLEEFEIWAKQVREAMVHVSEINNKRVLTIIWTKSSLTIDEAGIKALSELMKFNKSYATKTAVYGLGPFGSAIIHSTIVITHRYSMKVFHTEEEAMEWLKNDQEGLPPTN